MKEDTFYRVIPAQLLESLERYEKEHVPTGGFLRAVLSNDLAEAALRADEYNRQILQQLIVYIHNEMPQECWGSPEKVRAWIEEGDRLAEEEALREQARAGSEAAKEGT